MNKDRSAVGRARMRVGRGSQYHPIRIAFIFRGFKSRGLFWRRHQTLAALATSLETRNGRRRLRTSSRPPAPSAPTPITLFDHTAKHEEEKRTCRHGSARDPPPGLRDLGLCRRGGDYGGGAAPSPSKRVNRAPFYSPQFICTCFSATRE